MAGTSSSPSSSAMLVLAAFLPAMPPPRHPPSHGQATGPAPLASGIISIVSDAWYLYAGPCRDDVLPSGRASTAQGTTGTGTVRPTRTSHALYSLPWLTS
ncbi:unnamed protein product [Prorocentrum cordatum]|uniref:Secreted protein n=1 Tax=Prorocentrum cordatum TaxID=2364126 RepID=A0ABN9T6M1_9DINO|nr:unnamed protein product [Polarella glacialis]